jgi:hypothetical protein
VSIPAARRRGMAGAGSGGTPLVPLADAVDATEALLQPVRVPRQVVVHHEVGDLEVEAHARRVGGGQRPALRIGGEPLPDPGGSLAMSACDLTVRCQPHHAIRSRQLVGGEQSYQGIAKPNQPVCGARNRGEETKTRPACVRSGQLGGRSRRYSQSRHTGRCGLPAQAGRRGIWRPAIRVSNVDIAASLGRAGGGQVAFAGSSSGAWVGWSTRLAGRPRGRSPTSRWWSPPRRMPRTGSGPRWSSAVAKSTVGPHLDGVSARAAPVGGGQVEHGPLFIGKVRD